VNAVLLVNLAATLFLTGLVWFLQVVHLPLLLSVSPAEFAGCVTRHRRRNTLLMTGPMLAEAYTAVRLCWDKSGWDKSGWDKPTEFPAGELFGALVLLVIVWMVTFAWHMPQYQRLRGGSDNQAIHGLILSNWVRTACWTGRSAIMLWITAGRLRI
jgi:hypothetical protein